jgi:hypothetical protein
MRKSRAEHDCDVPCLCLAACSVPSLPERGRCRMFVWPGFCAWPMPDDGAKPSPAALAERGNFFVRSIGIDVEFHRERKGPFMTVAMTEDEHTSERDRGRSLIDLSFRAHVEH